MDIQKVTGNNNDCIGLLVLAVEQKNIIHQYLKNGDMVYLKREAHRPFPGPPNRGAQSGRGTAVRQLPGNLLGCGQREQGLGFF